MASLVQEKLVADPDGRGGAGDLNDYYASGPVDRLRTGVNPPLVHAYERCAR
ncbi:MAG: hypothetical protein R2838_20750 [Caldilineaceae bacterium]